MGRTGLRASVPPLPWRKSPPATPLPSAPPSPSAKAPGDGIDIALGEHWIIAGMTGTGKTTGTKALLAALYGIYQVPVVIADSKGDPRDFGGVGTIVERDDPPAPPKAGIQVWRPGIDDLHAYDAWFEMLRRAPWPIIVLIDEVSSVSEPNRTPVGLQRLMKQGRSLGKTVIANTQEMAGVPKQIKSQATHVVRQRLVDAYDCMIANKLLRLANDAPGPQHKYGLIYGRTDKPGTREFRDWHDFLKG